MRQKYYTLDANNMPVDEPDLLAWGRWLETANRIVKQEDVGGYYVSTVFLGLDHSFGGSAAPLLFESMAFRQGSHNEEECARCSTWEEAVEQHARMVAGMRDRPR